MTTSAQRSAAVTALLRDAGELGRSEAVADTQQLPGGWSRHTYIAKAALASREQRRYIVRVKPKAALLDTDLGLEYRVYDALDEVEVPTPHVYALVEDDETPFGGPYMVMEHIGGTAFNMYSREDQAHLAEDWDGPRAIAEDMVDTLARIHGMSRELLPADLPELDFLDIVARWRGVYEDSRLTRDPVVEEAFEWVLGRVPKDPWRGLVHGDYRIGNTLVADGRVKAILDWELVYCGDMRFDLGYLSMPRAAGKHLRSRSSLMGAFAERQWFLDRYAALTARPVDIEVVRTFEMLGIMMLLATQFTAVWLYANGRTSDFRMAWSRFSFAGLRQDMIRLMQW